MDQIGVESTFEFRGLAMAIQGAWKGYAYD